MSHFEKKLASETIFNGRILTLKRDTVMLENGATATREVIEHNGGVAVLAREDNGDILFVSQFRYPFGTVLRELPAGKLEKGENPAACGMRELEEECGCIADSFLPLGELYPTCAYDTEVIHLFFATRLRAARQKLDEDEFLTVERISLEQALELILDGKLPDAKTQLAILRYKALLDAGRL